MVGKQMVQMHLVGCRSKYMDKKEQSWQNVVIQQVVQVDVQEVLAVVVPVQVAQLARAVALEQVVVHLLLVAVLIALVVMAILVMIVVAAVAIVS